MENMDNNQYYQPTQPADTPPQNNGYYQQPPYQQPYQAPYQPMPVYDDTREVMSIGSYIAMFILSAIPIVNIICWIVWLVSPNTNKNKKNFILAQIIIIAVSYAVAILACVVAAGAGVSMLDSFAALGLLM
ncbi:hypothetical protein [uncultured Eubacterium sp.]|uniref:hypothetical protein n=1 Tax=uncultured Eubacterium sp. TaxID=165185 RepID=UPI0015A87FAB|nr:hypothetical protein [uncultured Eubacterium sp.]